MPTDLLANTHVSLNLGSAGEVEGWEQFDMPGASLQMLEASVWDATGKPEKTNTSATMTWAPVSGQRPVTQDALSKLHDAMVKAHDTPQETEDFEISVNDKEGNPVVTWSLESAYISDLKVGNQAAGSADIARINVTITYKNATKA